jgi:hypothetical protein
MPAIEQDKVVSSAIVDAFTLAIVEVCQTLNHQRGGLPLPLQAFATEFENRAVNLPGDPSGKLKKDILMNIAGILKGKPPASIQLP